MKDGMWTSNDKEKWQKFLPAFAKKFLKSEEAVLLEIMYRQFGVVKAEQEIIPNLKSQKDGTGACISKGQLRLTRGNMYCSIVKLLEDTSNNAEEKYIEAYKTLDNPNKGKNQALLDILKACFQEWKETGKVLEQEITNLNEHPPDRSSESDKLTNFGRRGRDSRKFFGREETLDKLHKTLLSSNAILSLRGMGGIGKSELSIQYAKQYRQHYPGGVWWLSVPAGKLYGDINDITKIRFPKFLGERILEFDSLERRAQECWKEWQATDKALVIFDDVEEYDAVKPYFPPSEFTNLVVVITTRLKLLNEFLVGKLSEIASIDLLVSPIGKERVENEIEDAKKLCKQLGYLPLALELVGKFLTTDPNIKIADLRNELEGEGMLEHDALIRDETDGTWELTADRGVKAAFETSWKYLNHAGQYTALAIGYVASDVGMADEEFEWSYIERILEDPDWSPADLKKGMRSLLRLSLMEVVEGENMYYLHPLIRQYFREKSKQAELGEV